jgi:tetraacyldisaccharide 4'-kinase
VLVVSDATAGAAASEAWALGISQSCGAARTLGRPVPADVSHSVPGTEYDKKVLAVAGIAHPDRFVQSLREAGWNVVDSMAFKDHHQYSPSDVAAIQARMTSSGATAVFTTDKDAVRLERHSGALPVYRVPLKVEFDPASALFESIQAVLQ